MTPSTWDLSMSTATSGYHPRSMELVQTKERSLHRAVMRSNALMAKDEGQSSASTQSYSINGVLRIAESTEPSKLASREERHLEEMSLSSNFETGGYTDIECWDRIIINDIFQTRFVDLLGDYIEEPLAFLKMLTKTKSIVGGQFVFRFLNLLPGMARTGLPLLVFAPRLSQMIWSEFLFKIKLQCTIVSVPNVFEDYCVEYMKIEGKNHARIRILFSKRSSPLPMILAFGDTIRCSLINGRGVYVGYPDDVTTGRVVIGHTGPYAMPPLHG
ncbi:hypothetical protein F5877DRAFT_72367 [Lentinula edodes]|nr:hypothetical protein F5877DRAFT_72367 [Lentinula edodes]